MAGDKNADVSGRGLPAADLLKERRLALRLLAGGQGLNREIRYAQAQKPGLALAGDLNHLSPGKAQILGQSEITYLRSLSREKMMAVVEALTRRETACFIATKNMEPPMEFLQAAEASGTPVLQTNEKTSLFIRKLTQVLEKRLAPQISMHGVLISVQGVGLLILGKSGIGKSECALELISRGHRLVADDIIFIQRMGDDVIIGHGPDMGRHHMEIRGLGIINIKELFGVVSVMETSRVELVVELVDWNRQSDTDRLGLDDRSRSILDVHIPAIEIPVSPGRNLAVILEVAARNHLLRKSGYHAARHLDHKLNAALQQEAAATTGDGGAAP